MKTPMRAITYLFFSSVVVFLVFCENQNNRSQPSQLTYTAPTQMPALGVELAQTNADTPAPREEALVGVGPTSIAVDFEEIIKLSGGTIPLTHVEGMFFVPLLQEKLQKSKRKARDPEGENLLIALDRRTRFKVIAKIIFTAHQCDYRTYQFLVKGVSGGNQIITTKARDFERRSGLALSVLVYNDGFRVFPGEVHVALRTDWERLCRRDVPPPASPPACAYDFDGLVQHFRTIKAQHPGEQEVSMGAGPICSGEVIAATVASVQGTSRTPLFPLVVLSGGVW